MRLKTLLLTLLPAAASMAQPAAQKPADGQTYYVYNLGSAGYLHDSNNTITLSGSGTAVTLTKADDTAGTFFMTAAGGRISATPFEGLSTGGSGAYDQWLFTPVEGTDGVYNISYCMREANIFPFLYADAKAPSGSGLKMQPYLPADSHTAGQWIFVAESDYTENTVVLDETAESYSAAAGSGMTVILKRTFSPGCWNTFCVPFDIDKAQLHAAFGTDARLAEFTGCEGTQLLFTLSDKAEAGKPYFIYIGNSHTTPDDGYVFTGVNYLADKPIDVTHGIATFTGCFSSITAPAGSYVISKNVLYHTQSEMTVKGFRGVIFTSDASGKLNGWSIDDVTDGIDLMPADTDNADGQVYTIDGQKMRDSASDTDGMPGGVYVVKGKKIVIK